jgi:hypothetical protein
LLDRLTYEFPGADRAFIAAEFVASARQIARENFALIEEIVVDLYACVEDYEISGLNAERILAVRWACVMGVEYNEADVQKVAPCRPRGVLASCSCSVAGLTLSFVGGNMMYITPAPQVDQPAGAILRVAVAPPIDRCVYPLEFIAKYEDVMLHAVRSRLYGMRTASWYSRGESGSSAATSAARQRSIATDDFVGEVRGVVTIEKRRIL